MSDTDTDAKNENEEEPIVEDGPEVVTDDVEAVGKDGAPSDTAAATTTTDTEPEPETQAEPMATTEAMDAPSGIRLLEGEEVLHDLRPSWGNYSTSIWLGILTFWTGVGLLFFLWPPLARRNERYIVTNQRLIHRSGLFSTTTNEYRITDVRGIQTGQSFLEKLFGSGNIQFVAAGGSITFKGVPDAQHVANTIRQQKADLE